MEIVVVERAFEVPAVLSELQAAEDAVAWCLQQYRVSFVHSYVSLDKRSAICIYRAPDAESVVSTQRTAGLPVLRAWSADVITNEQRQFGARPNMATVLVERDFDRPLTRQDIQASFEQGKSCFNIHRAEWLQSYHSRSGTRLLCVYEAPDAESLRIAARDLGDGSPRIYSATVHTP
jgi:hypothetical protein